jgi:hypothetical protein
MIAYSRNPGYAPTLPLPAGYGYRATQAGLRIRRPDGGTYAAPYDWLADIESWEAGEITDRALLALLESAS